MPFFVFPTPYDHDPEGDVAEGIEEPDQRRMLIELGCRLGQGFLTGFPAEADAVERLIAAQTARRAPASSLGSTASMPETG